MLAESDSANIGKAGFFQPKMASGAAVGYLLLGDPNLLNAWLEMALERDSVSAPTNEMQILLLITVPLIKVGFRRSDSEQY